MASRTAPASVSCKQQPRLTRANLAALVALVAALTALLAAVVLPSSTRASRAPRTAHYIAQLAAMHSPAPPRTLRVGTLNVRYDFAARHPLSSLGDGERRWAERRDALVDMVTWEELDVVGFQEVLHSQFEDLQALLPDDEWGSVGVGRDDGRRAGEAVPIFYRRASLRLVPGSVSHRWLSPTPLKPGSRGWDAGQPRMVTFARFADARASGGQGHAEVLVANTHWDDRGVRAREESAMLIRTLVEEELSRGAEAEGTEPLVVLLGDLNSPDEEEGYQLLTGRRYPSFPKGGLGATEDGPAAAGRSFFDARRELAVRGSALAGPGAPSSRFGPLNTFTGFSAADIPKVIDFILPFANNAFVPLSGASSGLVGAPGGNSTAWKVARYGVLPNFYSDLGGRVPAGTEGARDSLVRSDHRLVVARFDEVVALRGEACGVEVGREELEPAAVVEGDTAPSARGHR
ncbi:hypothetical protein JCM3770_001927 [Rhodotorula araucariae]